jgi:hypothetical protein
MREWGCLSAIARQRQAELGREAAAHRLVGGGWLARRKRRAVVEPVHVSGWWLLLTDAELVVLGAELETVVAAHRRVGGGEPGARSITVRIDG